MIDKETLKENGYLYDEKNQSPILFEFFQHDMEDLMYQLDNASRTLRAFGNKDSLSGKTALALERHKQLLQGKIERHKDRREWK